MKKVENETCGEKARHDPIFIACDINEGKLPFPL
jgi:hypothetical protein